MKRYLKHRYYLFGLILTLWTGSAYPAGFAILENSVSGLGNAFAGVTASAEDASTIFFNPAGLSKHSGTQVVGGLHVILPTADFNTGNSTDGFGDPLRGGDGGNGGDDAFVPNLYIATDLTKEIRLGLGINAPFGLSTDYDNRWQGRYHAITSDLKVANINPTISIAFTEKFSIGFGVNAQRADLKITRAVDFGTICLATLTTLAPVVGTDPAECINRGLLPQAADGRINLTANDWSYGFNAGLLYEPFAGTRIGVAYRSKISHTLRGDAKFRVPAAFEDAANQGVFANTPLEGDFEDTAAQGDVDLPETIALGVFHQVNDAWALMADVTWTRWNRFEELRIEFDNPAQPDNVTPENWKNTLRYSLGTTYSPTSNWKFRLGFTYDESPIRSAEFRTPAIPDASRYWAAGGISFRATEFMTLDVSYARLFYEKPRVNNTDGQGHTLRGTYDANVNIISAGARITF